MCSKAAISHVLSVLDWIEHTPFLPNFAIPCGQKTGRLTDVLGLRSSAAPVGLLFPVSSRQILPFCLI